jgi:hypothetical protein
MTQRSLFKLGDLIASHLWLKMTGVAAVVAEQSLHFQAQLNFQVPLEESATLYTLITTNTKSKFQQRQERESCVIIISLKVPTKGGLSLLEFDKNFAM